MKNCVGVLASVICASLLAGGCASTSGTADTTTGGTTATDTVDGADGADGTTATSATDGQDGADGTTGADGSAGSDGSTGADGADGTTGTTGAPATPADLQDSAVSKGCDPNQQFSNGAVGVTMQLVLSTPVFDVSDNVQGFYAGQGSGDYSGILVTAGQGVVFPELAQGDAVEVTGDHVEFFCMTQLRASAVSRTGEGTPIEPTAITGDMLASDVTAEPLEGVLVKLENVTVEATSQYDFTVTGGALVTGSAFSAGYFPNVGDEIASLVGVVEFSFGQHRIQIRSADDIDATAAEATMKTIAEIQQDESSEQCTNEAGNLPPTQGNVKVEGVVVSPVESISDFLSGAYISADATGPWSGLFVIWSKSAEFAPAIGDKVSLQGDVKEFYCSTQLDASNLEVLEAVELPAAAVVASADIDESYEGSFVTIENPEVTSIENLESYGEIEVDGGLIIALSDFGVTWPAAVGDTVASITGAVKYSFGSHKLVPFGDSYITQ